MKYHTFEGKLTVEGIADAKAMYPDDPAIQEYLAKVEAAMWSGFQVPGGLFAGDERFSSYTNASTTTSGPSVLKEAIAAMQKMKAIGGLSKAVFEPSSMSIQPVSWATSYPTVLPPMKWNGGLWSLSIACEMDRLEGTDFSGNRRLAELLYILGECQTRSLFAVAKHHRMRIR